jgi:hypothetical protein
VSINKLNIDQSYLVTTNYWIPLQNIEDEEDEEEEETSIRTIQPAENIKSNKWIRRIERRKEWKLVLDSGATSNFVPEEMNLPKHGTSNKEVYLPNNSKLKDNIHNTITFRTIIKQGKRSRHLTRIKNTSHQCQ